MLNVINDKTKFYIAAPANFATGGPELLHQLAYKLKSEGKDVMMYYWPSNHPEPVHENYLQYGLNFVTNVDDDPNNILIVPETRIHLLEGFTQIKKIVWWLSVDNHFLGLSGLKGRINSFLLRKMGSQNYLFFNKKIKLIDYHLVQSKYAENALRGYGIENILHLGDYLHESFLDEETCLNKKENIVAYNPKKGITFTQQLIKYAPHIQFVPIENMTREQVVALLQRAKVYIDFGFHPGKDRIPREAAYLECCVITNKRGSARYQEDVPIMQEFKFDEKKSNLKQISNKIDDCFGDYDRNVSKFFSYKIEIKNQEREFECQMKSIFG
jgi:hypothetical protein